MRLTLDTPTDAPDVVSVPLTAEDLHTILDELEPSDLYRRLADALVTLRLRSAYGGKQHVQQ